MSLEKHIGTIISEWGGSLVHSKKVLDSIPCPGPFCVDGWISVEEKQGQETINNAAEKG